MSEHLPGPVLVTGGAGFIGSNLVDRLVSTGRSVAVVDDLSSGKRENLAGAPDVPLFVMDVTSNDLGDAFREVQPEVVMHLAAQLDVRVSVADPILDANINIIGTLNVCEAARRVGARKVIVASSGGTIYGEPPPEQYPIRESCENRPLSPYGISKRVLHDYLAFYTQLHGLDHTVLALSNVYGPRQDPHGEAGVVAIFLRALLRDEDPVIFGDGTQTRDYVYVADVVDAFMRALEPNSTGVFNIGTTTEVNVLDLLAACAAVTGREVEPRFAPGRPGELQRSCVDASLAKLVLGWTPSTSLPEGLALTADWVRSTL